MAYVLDKICYRLLRAGISCWDWYDERIRPIIDAGDKVREARKKRDEMGFACKKTFNIALWRHDSMPWMPNYCAEYRVGEKCTKECEHHDWNNRYVGVRADLRVAKNERNRAIMNLLFITRKFVQLCEYMRLARYEEAKATEVYSQYGNVSPKSREEWDRARKQQEKARTELFGLSQGK